MMVCCIRLAFLQLWREKGGALCRVLALAAILVPLVVIWGLKCGIVSSLRENLLRDPRTLEINILSAPAPFTEADFSALRARPELGYLQPDTGSIFTRVGVCPAAQAADAAATAYTLIPTSAGDPVLRSADMEQPAGDAVVITHKLAQEQHLKPGDEVRLTVYRNQHREKSERILRVAGVLPERCHSTAAVFAPAEFALELRRFLSAGNGTPGISADLHAGSYAALALPPGAAEDVQQALLSYDAKLLVTPAAPETELPEGTLLVHRKEGKMSAEGATMLMEMARSYSCAAYPYNPSLRVQLAGAGAEMTVCTETAVEGSEGECAAPPTLFAAPGSMEEGEETIALPSAGGEQSRIFCRVRVAEGVPEGRLVASPQLLCLLHLAQERLLLWDYRTGSVRYPEQAFYGMRLYADSLEHTEALLRFAESRGMVCRARLNTIYRVLQLERSLNVLFLIISIGAGLGALISFGMSLFNAAELHRRHYATIQLLGAGRLSLSIIPVVTALVETLAVLVVTLLCYHLIAWCISLIPATETGGAPPCLLVSSHALIFCGICFATAFVASLAAVGKVLSITPAEILRES